MCTFSSPGLVMDEVAKCCPCLHGQQQRQEGCLRSKRKKFSGERNTPQIGISVSLEPVSNNVWYWALCWALKLAWGPRMIEERAKG